MAIKHSKVSGKSDGADSTLVQPSDWNSDHTIDDGSITAAKLAASVLAGLGAQEFGNGSDGALVFDGSTTILGIVPSSGIYTLARDVFATDLTVGAGAKIQTNGFHIYCTGFCDVHDAHGINADGPSAPNQFPGTGVTATFYNVTNADKGGSGAGNAGNASTASPQSWPTYAGAAHDVAGGSTGAGGGGGSITGHDGGAGGAITPATANAGGYGLRSAEAGSSINNTVSSQQYSYGSGGGGGGWDGASGLGGGGGNGGRIVYLAASTLKTTGGAGTVSADGGAGHAGVSDPGGGGGGGGGGQIVVTYGTNQGLAFTVAGGAPGAGLGVGSLAGAAGHVGKIDKYNLSGDGT